jgi:very-short-patch-repair endonuclease
MREEMRSHEGLADLAERQHGVVSRRQLLQLGFSKSAIGRSSIADRLRRVHRGVYAVGHARLSDHGRCFAAVLACGDGAVLSHGSAAWLLGLQGVCPRPVEVTIPAHGHRRRGIWSHRTKALGPMDREVVDGIPTTSRARTYLDLAQVKSIRSLESMLERAERQGRLDLSAIDAILADHRGDPGTGRLLEATAIYRDPAFFRARSERLFRTLIRKADLPPPAMNTVIAGLEIDAYWEAERFAVEVDGWGTHRTRAAFERDPLRQEDLLLAGISSIRITARRIEREPAEVARRLAKHLASRRHAP